MLSSSPHCPPLFVVLLSTLSSVHCLLCWTTHPSPPLPPHRSLTQGSCLLWRILGPTALVKETFRYSLLHKNLLVRTHLSVGHILYMPNSLGCQRMSLVTGVPSVQHCWVPFVIRGGLQCAGEDPADLGVCVGGPQLTAPLTCHSTPVHLTSCRPLHIMLC